MKKVLACFIVFFICFAVFSDEESAGWWYVSTANTVLSPLFSPSGRIISVNRDGSYVFLADSGVKLRAGWLDIRPYGFAALSSYGPVFLSDKDGTLYAFSGDLSLLWKYRLGMASYPALSRYGDVFAVTKDNNLVRLNPSGRSLWHINFSGRSVPYVISAYGLVFVLQDNVLYAVTYGGHIMWQRQFPDDVRSIAPYGNRELVLYTGKTLISLDTDNNIKWSFPLVGLYDAVLLSNSSNIVLIAGSGDVFFFSYTGLLEKSFRTPFVVKSSLSYLSSDSTLILVSEKNRVFAVSFDGAVKDISPGKSQPYRGTPLSVSAHPVTGQVILSTTDWIVYGLDFFVISESSWTSPRGFNNTGYYDMSSANYKWWEKTDEFLYLKSLVDSSDVDENMRAARIIEKQIEKGNLAGKLDFYIYCIDLLVKKGIEDADMSRRYSQVRAKAYELAGLVGDSSMLYLLVSGLKYEALPYTLEGVLKGIAYYGFDPNGVISTHMSRMLKRLPNDTIFAISEEFITALSVILKYNRGNTAEKQAAEMVAYILHGPFPAGIRKKAIELLQ
ncbi:PQQ-binding-like beta-propeller repeat protein [Spirochaetia bacterium 38H-sp]|uniref:PQQ-binding-like beta-propeller repeat protein n=1 Tax=Rarispira pelagica TaxID=3141764 RepID=A0ABU9UAV7_9SPIR